MAIQLLNLGAEPTPTTLGGEGGDNYREAHTKINANFVYVDSRIEAVESRPVVDAALTSRVDALEPKVTANTAAIGDVGSVLDAINGVTV